MSISPKALDRQGETYPSVPSSVELSVVMPCLNEADTLAACIEGAQRALAENNIEGEIIMREVSFGDLDYTRTMRWVIPGAMLTALGFQTILYSFLISMFRVHRR